MTGIVFEGGTFRPIFSCGVMDALLSGEYITALLYWCFRWNCGWRLVYF